jgi:adenine-specific DNA-methyltransferase
MNMKSHGDQRIVLSWTGKDDAIDVKPGVLLYDQERSYGDQNTGNLLIHGNNLPALKTLEPEYAGKVKCIYIDPPYNSQVVFENYNDKMEHTTWLKLMKARLEILRVLLAGDGVIFIQIDNSELHYLKVLMDEIFGRQNYRNSIIVNSSMKKPAVQHATVERLNTGYDTILMYSKEEGLRIPNLFTEAGNQKSLGSWHSLWHSTNNPVYRFELFGITPKQGEWRWSESRTLKAVANYIKLERYLDRYTFNYDHQDDFDFHYKQYLEQNNLPAEEFELVKLDVNNKPVYYTPPSNKVLLDDNWMDLKVNGDVTGFETEVNEFLLFRILNWITSPGDLVLDAFLGSGTTAAVAQKMERRWIGIESGAHCYAHCISRLKAVIDGKQDGISKAVNWHGGGGFKFMELVL